MTTLTQEEQAAIDQITSRTVRFGDMDASLRGNHNVALAAIKHSPCEETLSYIGADLYKDPDFLLEAAAIFPHVLKHHDLTQADCAEMLEFYEAGKQAFDKGAHTGSGTWGSRTAGTRTGRILGGAEGN